MGFGWLLGVLPCVDISAGAGAFAQDAPCVCALGGVWEGSWTQCEGVHYVKPSIKSRGHFTICTCEHDWIILNFLMQRWCCSPSRPWENLRL